MPEAMVRLFGRPTWIGSLIRWGREEVIRIQHHSLVELLKQRVNGKVRRLDSEGTWLVQRWRP